MLCSTCRDLHSLAYILLKNHRQRILRRSSLTLAARQRVECRKVRSPHRSPAVSTTTCCGIILMLWLPMFNCVYYIFRHGYLVHIIVTIWANLKGSVNQPVIYMNFSLPCILFGFGINTERMGQLLTNLNSCPQDHALTGLKITRHYVEHNTAVSCDVYSQTVITFHKDCWFVYKPE